MSDDQNKSAAYIKGLEASDVWLNNSGSDDDTPNPYADGTQDLLDWECGWWDGLRDILEAMFREERILK